MSSAVVDGHVVSTPAAVVACMAMAVLYDSILYSPTVLLCLPPPATLNNFIIRWFICVVVASIVSVFSCSVLLGIRSFEGLSSFLGDLRHWTRPFMASHRPPFRLDVSFISWIVDVEINSAWRGVGTISSSELAKFTVQGFLDRMRTTATDALAWRNYVVAPFTEEVVFRAGAIYRRGVI